ncbi:MAG TPA: DUF3109 family protein [Flavisolibacter sp.]|jgi:hypothetical protein|nr:DUF3109 family protein [Flavisolibacter sp.]
MDRYFTKKKDLKPLASAYLWKKFVVIAIDNVLVSDDVVEAQFVCDLNKCKGGCCEDGDAGAPLEKGEKKMLDEHFAAIRPYLTSEGAKEIERQGRYVYDREFGWVTPTVNGKICAYGFHDGLGIIKCAIEQAYYDGKLEWKKPISCHLYPIKITRSKAYTMVNYEPRDVLCRPACTLGKKLKLPVYQFLKEAIVRQFGDEFYDTLHQVAIEHFEAREKKKK